RRVAAGVGAVCWQPLPQPARLADVEEAAVAAEQVVDARNGRDLVEPRPRDVDDERASVGGAALKIEELVQSLDASFLESLEEDAEDLGRDLGVGERAVAAEAGDAERDRDGVERAAAALGQQTAREADRAEHG